MNSKEKEDAITLRILQEIESSRSVNQRFLARKLGVALGLANSYLKRCVRKGLLKIKQAPGNRYLYYLTPVGFSEKARLTAQYLAASLSFYREASDSCARIFANCEGSGWRNLVLYGASALAEIACLRANSASVKIVRIVDPSAGGQTVLNHEVQAGLGDSSGYDAIIVTDLVNPAETYRQVVSEASGLPTLVPDILDWRSRTDHADRD